MDDAYNVSRECRSWRHQWRPYRAWKIKGGWEEQRQCVQCESIVVRLLDSRGYRISRRIIYAPGYLVKGLGRLTEDGQAELRLVGVRALAKREQPSE